ncbi:hypothetical protein PQX77_008631 [Marasmius sp. AFHP31]|nr:hypothetical protein PQX77_008631 [Marasmius sp. AFHP31]
MVVLVSSDSKEFTVDRDVAEHLAIINGPQLEKTNKPIPLPGVSSDVLEKVLEYCEHHRGETLKEDEHSQWDHNFIAGVDDRIFFELIIAANYLDVKPLTNLGSTTVANMIKGRTPEQIRALFNLVNDFTPEEEAQIRAECELEPH